MALTPADILPDKRLSINKNYAKVKGRELFLEPKTPKSKRNIALPDFLYDDIQEYVSKLYGVQQNDRIFYFTKHALDKEIKRIAEKAGLPKLRVHDLRHSHASLLINQGCDALILADRLGHEKVTTTLNTYSHLFPHKQQELVTGLEQLASNASITPTPEPPSGNLLLGNPLLDLPDAANGKIIPMPKRKAI